MKNGVADSDPKLITWPKTTSGDITFHQPNTEA